MKILLFITSILLAVAGPSLAQQTDSLAGLKLFMKVCNSYKQLPVQVDVDIMHSANFILNADDSAHMQAKFNLRKEGSYIALGEMEQIANDSIILLVSAKMKRMLVYTHQHSVAEQMQLSLGLQLKDSSLQRIAGRYTVGSTKGANDTAEISLSARTLVRLTSLPAETVRVRYDPVSLRPYEIRQVKRSLHRLTEADYRLLSQESSVGEGKLVHSDSSYFFVREQLSVFRYDRISHLQDLPLPVTMDDRITKDGNGNYQPVNKYEAYSVSREF